MKKMMKKLDMAVVAVAMAAGTLLAGESLAATAGSLGATSTGTVDISVTKTAQVKIGGMTDMTLASYSIGDGAVDLNTTACIYSSTAGGGYTVNATGSGAANAFTLDDGNSHTLAYTVAINDGGVGAIGTGGTALTAGNTSGSLSNAATDSATCAGASPGPTAQINVGITAGNMIAAPAGTYTGTLTLLVSPI